MQITEQQDETIELWQRRTGAAMVLCAWAHALCATLTSEQCAPLRIVTIAQADAAERLINEPMALLDRDDASSVLTGVLFEPIMEMLMGHLAGLDRADVQAAHAEAKAKYEEDLDLHTGLLRAIIARLGLEGYGDPADRWSPFPALGSEDDPSAEVADGDSVTLVASVDGEATVTVHGVRRGGCWVLCRAGIEHTSAEGESVQQAIAGLLYKIARSRMADEAVKDALQGGCIASSTTGEA